MQIGEISTLLVELDRIARQVDRDELLILRAARDRLAALEGGRGCDDERGVLLRVVEQARAELSHLALTGATGEQ